MGVGVVTVFGGSGFVGRYVVRALARRGARVRVAVRRPERALFLKTAGAPGQIVPVAADLRDDDSVRAAVEGADAVVNLVGILFERGRQRFDAIHRVGAGRVARLAGAAGARRLLHVSALGAASSSPSAYARSKAAGEAAARGAFPGAVVIRPSIVFGPEDDFFNRFAALARLTPALPLFGGGATRFQPVYVGDVARAAAALLEDPDAAGRTYELAGPHVRSFKALLELVLEATGRRRLLLPVPYALAEIKASLLQLLPVPPLTRDQVRLLRADNVAGGALPGLAELGIEPTALEAVVPACLERYRRGGARRRGGAPGTA